MGCFKSKNLNYVEFRYEEEVFIRQFEEDKLNCFNRPFSSLIQSFASDKEYIAEGKIMDFFKREYSETMLKLVMTPFFEEDHNGVTYYNASKVRFLVYLTSYDSQIKVNGQIMHDKIGFLLSNIKKNPEEALSSPLNRRDTDFDVFMEKVFDIACEQIVDVFYDIEKKSEGQLKGIRNLAEQIKNEYIENLFTIGGKLKESINYDDIVKKFEENPFLFTTGDIRELGWKIMKENK